MIFHCNVIEPADTQQPTLFLVDYDTPGVTLKHDPDYTHTFADRHPQFVLEDVRVPTSAVLGGVGRADELTNEWFVEERIHIGARCAGAMERLLTMAVEWATEREPVRRADLRLPGRLVPAGRLGGGRGGRPAAHARGGRPSRTRAPTRRSSTPSRRSRSCSRREAAFRCADRVVQVFGGRGYMRENPPSASSASSASTGSGRARPRSSG